MREDEILPVLAGVARHAISRETVRIEARRRRGGEDSARGRVEEDRRAAPSARAPHRLAELSVGVALQLAREGECHVARLRLASQRIMPRAPEVRQIRLPVAAQVAVVEGLDTPL